MKLTSPPFVRNREPMLRVLEAVCGARSGLHVLEIGCGPGQHACWFTEQLAGVALWQPTDPDLSARESVDAWAAELGIDDRVLPAFPLTIGAERWSTDTRFDVVFTMNVLHMMPESQAVHVMARCAEVLRPGGSLVVYECFTYDGAHVSASNAAFHERLAASYGGGVHAIETFTDAGQRVGFGAPVVHWLPANNQGVVWTLSDAVVEPG